MFVFLLLAARMLEQRARIVANAQVDALARARPALATRECADGSREVVPVSALAVGDIACVAAGATVPADGVLLDAVAQLEEALLTGESHPISKRAGDVVLSYDVLRIKREYDQSRLETSKAIGNRKALQASLTRQDAILARLRGSPYLRAAQTGAHVAFGWGGRCHIPLTQVHCPLTHE
jgi:Cu2+-exporting ATPase